MAGTGWARRLLAWVPLVLVVALGAVFLTVFGPERDTPLAGSADTSTSTPSTENSTSTTAATSAGPMVAVDTGEPILGVTADWEVFVRGTGKLVRIELARGRITRTDLPALRTSGPVSFLVGPELTIIRPIDAVDGYLVPDGEPARQLPDALNHGGQMVLGPEPGTVWMVSREGEAVLRRVDGRATGRSIDVPRPLGPVASDRRGEVVVYSVGGTYLTGPDGLERISTGMVRAIGVHHFLATECDDNGHCADVLIDRADGSRTVVADDVDVGWPRPSGRISPDGSTAALPAPRHGGIQLIDLSSGARETLSVTPGSPFYFNRLAWSPDSEWLFAIGSRGLRAIDAATHEIRTVDLEVDDARQVAVRAAPS